MPKTLWLPGGRGGGGHRETFYTAVEVHKMLRDVESKTQTAMLVEFVKDGYGLSRPSQNPPVLPSLDPVQRVHWWETIDSTPCFFVTVVALILIVLVAMMIQGVAW